MAKYKLQLVSADGKTVYGEGPCDTDRIKSGKNEGEIMLKGSLSVSTEEGDFRGFWNAQPFDVKNAVQQASSVFLGSLSPEKRAAVERALAHGK